MGETPCRRKKKLMAEFEGKPHEFFSSTPDDFWR
jgi:hypothetical protein